MREVTLLFCLQRSCFWGGSIDVCHVPYLGISRHVLGISPHVLMDFNDIHERKKSGKNKAFLDANPDRKK